MVTLLRSPSRSYDPTRGPTSQAVTCSPRSPAVCTSKSTNSLYTWTALNDERLPSRRRTRWVVQHNFNPHRQCTRNTQHIALNVSYAAALVLHTITGRIRRRTLYVMYVFAYVNDVRRWATSYLNELRIFIQVNLCREFLSWKLFDFKCKLILQTKETTWKWLSGQF
jgi:hypothetical protein